MSSPITLNTREVAQLIRTQFKHGSPEDMFLLLSSPGVGKSAIARQIAADPELGFEDLVETNLSLVDAPDVAGLAYPGGDAHDNVLQWQRSPLLERLRHGRKLALLEETGDATMMMQNLACRLQYDRELNGTAISPDVHFIACSNRTVDKSGAGRISTKYSGRVTVINVVPNLDVWVEDYAFPANINPLDIQWLRFRPGLFSDFNPDAPNGACPTPRNWTRAFRTVKSLPAHLFTAKVAGDVGDGAAVEYAAFLRLADGLTPIEEILANPSKVPVSNKPDVLHCTVGSLAHHAVPEKLAKLDVFVRRLPQEFRVFFWLDAIKRNPKIKATKEFIAWASDAGNSLLS